MDDDDVVKMVTGECAISDPTLRPHIQNMQDSLASIHFSHIAQPRCSSLPFLRHITRSCNQYADKSANQALDSGVSGIQWSRHANDLGSCDAVMLHVGGASRGNPGLSSSAAVLSGSMNCQWFQLQLVPLYLGHSTGDLAASLDLGLKLLGSFICYRAKSLSLVVLLWLPMFKA